VKTHIICHFSGFKIYPGHGKKFIRIDSKAFNLIDPKCEALFLKKKNPRKIPWTQVYRKLHKKGTTEEIQKKKTRRAVKLQRAIVGAPLEVIRAKRNQKPEQRQASREAALREIKERKRAKTAQKKEAAKKTATTPASKATKIKPSKQKQAATKTSINKGR